MKYIYTVYVEVKIEYKRCFNKYEAFDVEDLDYVFYCSNPEDAIKRAKEFYGNDYVPFRLRVHYDKYKTLSHEWDAMPDNKYTFEYLKKHMDSDEFLEYCKDRLYPVIVAEQEK